MTTCISGCDPQWHRHPGGNAGPNQRPSAEQQAGSVSAQTRGSGRGGPDAGHGLR